MKRPGRDIDPSQSALIPHTMISRQKIMPPRIQQRILGQRAWRDQPHDLAFDHRLVSALFRLGGAFHLFANRHAKSFADQRQEIPFGGVMGHATHRNVLIIMLTTFGQRDIQRFCRGDGIIKKHLVKIAHPVKQDRIGMRCLNLQILRHHGRCGGFGAGHASPRIISRTLTA